MTIAPNFIVRPALAVALTLAMTTGSALGAVYKWKDSTGRVQLSDQPPKDVDAEILHVAPNTMQGASASNEDSQGDAQDGSNASVDSMPKPGETKSAGSTSPRASTSAAAMSQSTDKTPDEIALENRKIRQAKRDKCNATLTTLLTRGNTTRTSQPAENLRKELRENCR